MSLQNLSAKYHIIGGGIIAYMNAYMIMKSAWQKGEKVKITMYEKNECMKDTTTMHLVPSLTPDEMTLFIPSIEEMEISFKEPKGIRVDDVPAINSSVLGKKYISQVKADIAAKNQEITNIRQELLLALGKMSMEMWDRIYQEGDEEFKQIMNESNYNPCKEISDAHKKLHKGYRIDLISKLDGAAEEALAMQEDYKKLGFLGAEILSPDALIKIDPSLKDFAEKNSTLQKDNSRKWHDDSSALWCPGGCIDTGSLLPKLNKYLVKHSGKYIDSKGVKRYCFRVKYGREVIGVKITGDKIVGLKFSDKKTETEFEVKHHKAHYHFFPGEAVGTLERLGFMQPPDSGFAGASLMLKIKVPIEKEAEFKNFNHCMEVYHGPIVLAWQAKYHPTQKEIFVGAAGTKAFYADIIPKKEDEFCQNRTLLQLNVINEITPSITSLAFNCNTRGKKLTKADLDILEKNGTAILWVGRRSAAYDGMPTVGNLSTLNGKLISNAKVATHAGSGGVSFSAGLSCLVNVENPTATQKRILEVFSPNRRQ